MNNLLLLIILFGLIFIIIYDNKCIESFSVKNLEQLKSYYDRKNICTKIYEKKKLKCDNTNIKNCLCANNINLLENINENIIDQILKDIKQIISEIINKKLEPKIIDMNNAINKTLNDINPAIKIANYINIHINKDSTKYDKKIKKDLKDEMTYLDRIKNILLTLRSENKLYQEHIENLVEDAVDDVKDIIYKNKNNHPLLTNIDYNTIQKACNDNIFSTQKGKECEGFKDIKSKVFESRDDKKKDDKKKDDKKKDDKKISVGGKSTSGNFIESSLKKYKIEDMFSEYKLCKKLNNSSKFCEDYETISYEMINSLSLQFIKDLKNNGAFCKILKDFINIYTTEYEKEINQVNSLLSELSNFSLVFSTDRLELEKQIKDKNCQNVYDHWINVGKGQKQDIKTSRKNYGKYMKAGYKDTTKYTSQKDFCDSFVSDIQKNSKFTVGYAQGIRLIPIANWMGYEDCDGWDNKCNIDCKNHSNCIVNAIEQEYNSLKQILKDLHKVSNDGKQVISILNNSEIFCSKVLDDLIKNHSKNMEKIEKNTKDLCDKHIVDFCAS